MAERKYYVLCDANCKFEGMSKEQILTAITQAVKTGSVGNCDVGFITTVKTINGKPLKFFYGTQAEYETLSADQKQNLFALITNDTTRESLLSAMETLQGMYDSVVQTISDANYTVPKANRASRADADKNGVEFTAKHFHQSGYVYSGNAVRGVEIYGKKGGHSYIVNWYVPGYGCYCFGVIHWGGGNTFSTEVHLGNGYVVKIEPNGTYDNDYIIGKATIIENDYGFVIDISNTELELISLTDSIPAE